jgi:two-component system chemotaxis sensor kinase CheA
MDMTPYRDLFISEARDHLRAMTEITLLLETASAEREQIDALFRHSHSLKGMAASMGYTDMAELAHRMEDLMDRVRKEHFPFTAGCADLILEGADQLKALVDDVEQGETAPRAVADLICRITGYEGEESGRLPSSDSGKGAGGTAGDDVAATFPLPQRAVGDPGPADEPATSGQTVRIRSALLDQLVTVTGELVTIKHRLAALATTHEASGLSEAVGDLSLVLRELHDRVMQARVMPFGGITQVFPRLVRDLARKSGKKIALEILGREIELDRAVLEEMGEPLVHILRNAVDHGIEPAKVRAAAGKPESGTIRVRAFREKDCVVISIEDDGRGMDPAQLVVSAVRKGFIRPEAAAALAPSEALMLTCIPGFSTTEKVTEVSGRGVGMDAVNALIRSFGGTLAIESEPGQGSRIILKIPRNIAIINVLLVSCGQFTVGVPLSRIHHLVEVPAEHLTRPDGRLNLPGEERDIPLLDLNELLGLSPRVPDGAALPALVTEIRGRTVALLADRFAGQKEVFIRPLGRPLASLRGLAGSALLGDGSSLFILDISTLG